MFAGSVRHVWSQCLHTWLFCLWVLGNGVTEGEMFAGSVRHVWSQWPHTWLFCLWVLGDRVTEGEMFAGSVRHIWSQCLHTPSQPLQRGVQDLCGSRCSGVSVACWLVSVPQLKTLRFTQRWVRLRQRAQPLYVQNTEKCINLCCETNLCLDRVVETVVTSVISSNLSLHHISDNMMLRHISHQ